MNTAIVEKPKLSITQKFQAQMDAKKIPVSPYANRCIDSACRVLQTMPQLNLKVLNEKQTNAILQIFTQINQTELNCFSRPDECTIIMYGDTPKLQIIGEGNIKIKRQYGVNVKEIRPSWIVKSGDDFIPPHFKGIEVVAPEWTPHGKSNRVECVCTPVIYLDNSVEYFVAYRNAVKVSILAFLSKQNAQVATKYADSKYSVDDIINADDAKPFLKNAYSSANIESMIATKLKIKSVASIPVDFTKCYDSQALVELNKNALDVEDDRGIVAPIYSEETDDNIADDIATEKVDTSGFEKQKSSDKRDEDLPF